jgi:plastocyanin
MRRTLLVLLVGLAVAAFAVAGCGGDDDDGAATDTETTTETTDTGAAAGEELYATVGSEDDPDAFVITLTTEDGADVTTLSSGTYTIEVNDLADIHNFHLTGPGVDETTSVAETGEQTWEVTFEAGEYTYVCDPHAGTMNGSFEVTG